MCRVAAESVGVLGGEAKLLILEKGPRMMT